MNKQQFTKLIKHPTGLKGDLYELHDLQKQYPYCQSIHVLVALANKEADTEHAGQTLSYAAMYVSDRGNLRSLLDNSPKTNVAHTSIPENNTEIIQEDSTKIALESETSKSAEINNNLPVKATEVLPAEPTSGLPAKKESKFTYKKSNDVGDQMREDLIKNLENLRLAKKRWETDESITENQKKSIKTDNPAPKTPSSSKSTKPTSKRTNTKKETKTKKIAKKVKPAKEIKKTEEKAKEKKPEKKKVKEQQELISKFIQISPSIKAKAANPPAVDPNQKDLSVTSTSFGENLISENLAEIMVKQGKIEKAVDIYKKLIWKYPQKKAYFAARIEELNKSEG